MPSATPLHTILVTDDNAAGRYATCRALEAAGFAIIESAGGAGALELAKRGVSAVVLDVQSGRCSGGRISVTGLADHAFRANLAEAALTGYAGQPEHTERLLGLAFNGIDPLKDRFADADYRTQLARTMLRRALADAVAAD